MKIPVSIVSGFLGAGKTTLIRQFLQQDSGAHKTWIIENDFGEIGLDAAILKGKGATIRELTNGCICCTLAGDFETSLRSILLEHDVEQIIIEPSGVALLSDIIKACTSPDLKGLLRLASAVTVVDARQCELYLRNFGEFYRDQLRYSDRIFLTHADQIETLYGAIDAIQWENNHAWIYEESADRLHLPSLLFPDEVNPSQCEGGCPQAVTAGEALAGHSHDHAHAQHDHTGPFTELTLTAVTPLPMAVWEKKVRRLIATCGSQLLRLKGVVPAAEGNVEFQFAGQTLFFQVTTLAAAGIMLIGTSLDEATIRRIWED